MRSQPWISIVLITIGVAWWLGCDDDPPPEQSTAPVAGDSTGRAAPTEASDLVDERAPLFGGIESTTVEGWGRVRFDWTAAADNVSPSGQISYRLRGLAPHDLDIASDEPLIIDTPPGVVRYTAVLPPTHTIWTASAIDQAGNESEPSEPVMVQTVPSFVHVGTEASQGRLTNCLRNNAGTLVCGGTNGRYIGWLEPRWLERQLPISDYVRVIRTPDDTVQLVTSYDYYRFDARLQPQRVERQFDSSPTYPLRRFVYEPSGLALWLDGDGVLWGANGGVFRPFDNPVLAEPDRPCSELHDIAFEGTRGFAWCEGGDQYLLRADTHGYRWIPLPDHDGLPDGLRAKSYLFGEGRQLSLLATDGTVWRYDLGGWRTLRSLAEGDTPAGAMAWADDARLLWVAVGSRILAFDVLGQAELVYEIPSVSPIVYIEPLSQGGIAVTARAELFDLAAGEFLRSVPPAGYTHVIRLNDEIFAVLTERPETGLYTRLAQGWSLVPLPSLNSSFFIHDIARLDDDETLFAGDMGESGGQIKRVRGHRVATERFLYPRPVEPGGAPEEPPPTPDEPALDEFGMPLPPPHPSERLLGVAADELLMPPPPPPPVRGIDYDEPTATGVAVGEGGTIWLKIEGGWLSIDPGIPFPTPLLSVRITGDHHYLVGGVDGLVLECDWDQCQTAQAPIGDITAFRRVGSDLIALGTQGIARRTSTSEWEALPLAFDPPYPSGAAPAEILAYDTNNGQRWVLTRDGSVWFEVDSSFQAMALLEGGLDLWVEPNGDAIIVAGEGMFRISPLN